MEKIPLFAFPLVGDLNLINQLATIVEEMLAERIAQIANQMDIDLLSSLPDHVIHQILSFMDTKDAVQTCVLSKRWRNQWTHILNLNIERTERRITNFKNFVLHVLNHRTSFKLKGLRFHLYNAKSQALMRKISSYALSRGLEELDTNLTTFPPSFYQCQTLTTLKLGPYSGELPDLSTLPSLATLELTEIFLLDGDFFSRCLTLVNFTLIDCRVVRIHTLNISAPKLVNLTLLNFSFSGMKGKIIIMTPQLKFFNWKEINPLELGMDDCPPSLEEVDIYLSQPCQKAHGKKQTYILDMLHAVEGIFRHVKLLRISMNFPKEKFILCRKKIDGETKIVVVDKVTGARQLVGLATIVEEN